MTTLTTGSPGAAIDTSSATNKDLPAWYQQYTQNLAGQGAQLAQNINSQPLPQASVAGFNPTQTQAFQQTQDMQGAWQPGMTAATNTAAQIAPTATGLVGNAQSAVAGPAQTWDSSAAANYMSPYTSAVTDNIARLGQRNFEQNIMPGVNASMIGSGQFGSTRNADVLGQAAVQASNDITGQQSAALQAGYGQAQSAFAADANRTQQQGQIQANTALTGANADTYALNTGAQTTGALTQTAQNMGNTDNANLLATGNQQQALQQKGLDTDLSNANTTLTQPWTQLQNQASLISGMQLPNAVTSTSSQPASAYGPSAVSGALSAYYLTQGLNSDGSTPAAGVAPH
jgi:hypothetical protein